MKMEKEISQSLEDLKRQHSVKRGKLMQELELRFIASLVRHDLQCDTHTVHILTYLHCT